MANITAETTAYAMPGYFTRATVTLAACFGRGVSSELLSEGIPVNIVTRLMRHSDAKVTLNNCGKILRSEDRAVAERWAAKIEAQLESSVQMEVRSSANRKKIKALVRKVGFEPTRLAAPPPQDGASASSATSAQGRVREEF
jgi:hypothetical protein